MASAAREISRGPDPAIMRTAVFTMLFSSGVCYVAAFLRPLCEFVTEPPIFRFLSSIVTLVSIGDSNDACRVELDVAGKAARDVGDEKGEGKTGA